MEWLKSLNEYAGLFSLLAVVAAIIVPFIIYCKERRDAKRTAKSELDAINDLSQFPMTKDERDHFTHKRVLEETVKQ